MVFVLALAVPLAAQAKKKDKGKKDEPQATPAPDPADPIQSLSPYIVNLDALLALNRPPTKSLQTFFAQASGTLVTMRQEFIVQATGAPPEKKNLFVAAINTSDLIAAALNDREKTLGDLAASSSVANSGKLEELARKDNLTQGIHGGGLAKAVGSEVERDREREANAKAARRAAQGDHAIQSMAANEWNQRAIAWRQRISDSFSQIR